MPLPIRPIVHRLSLVLLLIGATSTPHCAADTPIVPAGTEFECLWNEGEFTEGVACAADGTIYFSDIPSGGNPGRVLKFVPASGETTVHCADSGKSNGLMFDRTGRLMASCGANVGKRALCEITGDGQVRVLVDRFEGKRFNSPNDLVIHPDGSIYFSDPRYVGSEPVELDHQSVFRFVPATQVLERVTTDISKPNGVILSPDGKQLFVAETDNGMLDASQPPPAVVRRRMTLNRLPVHPDGSLGPKEVIVNFGDELGIDGMTVDVQGNIYAALRSTGRHGIVIYSQSGEERGFLPTDELPTNCCFGRGAESTTLYATIGGGLFRVKLTIDGYHLPPAQ